MAQENRAEDLVVRLLDGRSEQSMLVLERGTARRPLVVGREGAWTVNAVHVAAAHVVLAFNGSELYVCAVRGERALLDGKTLGRRWTLAAVPGELRFGSARLVIRTRAGDEETVAALPEPNPTPRVEEPTTIDEIRLAEALRLSMEDARMPATAEIDVPVTPRRGPRVPTPTPTPPMRRPAIRPIVVPIAHLLRGLDSRSE